jgi:hypothetical protein
MATNKMNGKPQKNTLGLNEFLRYSLSGYFFIGIILLSVYFYPGILGSENLKNISSQINENPIVGSILILIIGYPLGYVFYAFHQVFYRIWHPISGRDEIIFLKKKLRGNIRNDEYIMGLHDIALFNCETAKERIIYLSSVFHSLGSIFIACIVGIFFVWYMPLYNCFAKGNTCIELDIFMSSMYIISIIILLASILYYRRKTWILLNEIELIFTKDKLDKIEELHDKIKKL